MASDELTAAAERADELWPGPIAWAVNARLNYSLNDHRRHELAAAVLALPAPVPADRETLTKVIGDLSNHNPFPEAEDIADGLLDAYHVTAKQGDDR
jgi:hypothetical protein